MSERHFKVTIVTAAPYEGAQPSMVELERLLRLRLEGLYVTTSPSVASDATILSASVNSVDWNEG